MTTSRRFADVAPTLDSNIAEGMVIGAGLLPHQPPHPAAKFTQPDLHGGSRTAVPQACR